MFASTYTARMCPFMLLLLLLILSLLGSNADPRPPPNVLLIMSEDLRPELPFYGNTGSIAPNLARLARKSVTFDLAVCQVSICAPSRASMLTGLRPDTLGIYDFGHFGGLRFMRTIPSHLHSAGYNTAMAGKIFHYEASKHYSRFYYGQPVWERVQRQEMKFHNASVTPDALHEAGAGEQGNRGNSSFYRDAHIADHAVQFLRQLHRESPTGAKADAKTETEAKAESEVEVEKKPWFLGVGFKGTHLPYQMPQRYWDAYARHSFPLPGEDEDLAQQALRSSTSYHPSLTFPPSTPLTGLVNHAESRFILYMDKVQNGTVPGTHREAYQRTGQGRSVSTRGWGELFRGYLACVSYMDSQLGRVLDEMDALDLWENTVVIFTSDHGMHLGEKGMWAKWSLFDEATRVPLLVHDPLYPLSYGQHYSSPVELLDLFPSLVDMTDTQTAFDSCDMPRQGASSDSASGHRTTQHEGRRGLRRGKGEKANHGTNTDTSPGSGAAGTTRIVGTAAQAADQENRVYRHQYCDKLDGKSFRPVFKAMQDKGRHYVAPSSAARASRRGRSLTPPTKDFAITQKMVCRPLGQVLKLPKTPPSSASAGHHGNTRTQLKNIDYRMIDPYSGSWTEHCPFKMHPEDRWPNYGAMGYSIRTADWRYTAWVLLDINTYLPALDVPPLAEELYDHRDLTLVPEITKTQSLDQTSSRTSSLVHPVVGMREMINLVNSTDGAGVFQAARTSLRHALYDFLYQNATYEHHFHGRAQEQLDFLYDKNELLGERGNKGQADLSKRKADLVSIIKNRAHGAHPHWALYAGHFFSTA